MRFEELNWFDVEDYLKHEDRIIFVLGACEQHGYLSLLSDVMIPQALADAASQKTGVLVAPTLNFGSSPYFQAYPGTLSLRSSTLMDIVEDLIRSAYQQGFKRYLFLNGHGGNDAVRSRLYEMANLFPSIQIAWYAWWLSHSVEEVAKQNHLKPAHANWLEAFQFTQVSELPESEKTPPRVPGLMNAGQTRQVYGDGSFGGPYQASESVMENIFQAALDDILQLLKFE